MTTLLTLLTFAGLCTAPSQSNPTSTKHTVFLVDTSGSAYRLGYLRNDYVDYISGQLNNLDKGSTVTCIAYDGNAGFHPENISIQKIDDALLPIQTEIYSTRDYWGRRIRTQGKRTDLESAPRGGTRLDLALELLMRERKIAWRPNALVTIYFLTDGGVDFRRGGPTDKVNGRDVSKSVNVIQRDMKALWNDPRVKAVYVCGLKEQTGNVFPSQVFGARTIVEQWRLYWLKGAPDLHVIDFNP